MKYFWIIFLVSLGSVLQVIAHPRPTPIGQDIVTYSFGFNALDPDLQISSFEDTLTINCTPKRQSRLIGEAKVYIREEAEPVPFGRSVPGRP